MKTHLTTALLCCATLTPLATTAAPDPALAPLAFLAGSCWKGALPGTPAADEHCFSWMYDGKYLRDRHEVRDGEKVVYAGESIYYWNAAAKQVEYFYITAAGGHSHGTVVPEADAISFPAASLVMEGKSMGFRSRWKRVGDDGYEVLREYESAKGWTPVTIQMKKVK